MSDCCPVTPSPTTCEPHRRKKRDDPYLKFSVCSSSVSSSLAGETGRGGLTWGARESHNRMMEGVKASLPMMVGVGFSAGMVPPYSWLVGRTRSGRIILIIAHFLAHAAAAVVL